MNSTRIGLMAFTLLLLSMPVSAQHTHNHGHSPYVHTRSAELPTLTEEELQALRLGEGMGLARAAELNHFPGPRHLLDLAEELALSDEQTGKIRKIHQRMKNRAMEIGEEIIMAERHLSDLFAKANPSAGTVSRIAGHLGEMRGRLQATHLIAHIEATRELSTNQIQEYDRLRGYRQ